MGCDIHIHVEYKRDIDGEMKWICGDYFTRNPYYGVWDDEPELSLVDFCGDRNYYRFAILANVRNYGNTPYIDDPRGLPEDVTKEVAADCERWGEDGHSHSYFTLNELLDYQENIVPLRWCQGTNQAGWAFYKWEMENAALIPLIEAIKKRADELFVIYDGLWESNPKEAYKLSDNIRIVFWFDN